MATATGWRAVAAQPWVRLVFLIGGGLVMFGPLLYVGDWIYEDRNVLPWTDPIPRTFRLAYLIWGALHLTTAVQHHWLNLGVHALTSLLVGLVAVRLWNTREMGWLCAALFWFHPLAVPAVGYASALHEMLVCLGAVALVWLLLQDRTWYWIGLAGVVLFITLHVKQSAIGVLFVPAVMLVLRPINWKRSAGYLVAGLALMVVVGLFFEARVDFVRTTYPWRSRWPEEMLPQAAQAWLLVTQSILPYGIAFQLEPAPPWVGIYFWVGTIVAAVGAWLARHHQPILTFAVFYVLSLIVVRLVVPTSNWPDRAPEMWYSQQWYPALPGMVWLLVGAWRAVADACRAVPSAT